MKIFSLIAIFSVFLSLCYSVYAVLQSFDIVKEVYLHTGLFSIIFLFLCAFFSLVRFRFSAKFPLIFGISSFIYAFLHFLNYFVFDRNADIMRLFKDITSRLFEASGFIAFSLLFAMFLSSFKPFRMLTFFRKLVYATLLLASYHFYLSAKNPNVLEYSALILAILFCSVKIFKSLKKAKTHS